ncbi:EpsD family peptidyl-prolyl cis-trans isomerase [Qipengyuania sediminis]|uniref:EpsD family peptidyl-prolyl cis-trans isomerase n=1 Tax=Qipengyuania sediminis TaxID=1532023 RepID=UPI001404DE3D|nr:EpsD family peptidyl-prolyl cis-trans isomerase [Qipengyuania sediminis]
MTVSRASKLSVSARRGVYFFGAAAALAGLSACDKKAEGQVVAVVDGNEITAQEVNGELGAAAAQGEPDQQMRNVALNRLIDRRLLSEVAREEGIEDSPEYILRRRSLEENMLVQMLGEKLARDNKQPTPQQIDQMIAENPQAFADRTIFALDQIVFQMPPRRDVFDALAPAKTMAEVVTTLNRFGIKFQRGNNTIDSANLPPAVFQQFKRVGSSEPLVIPAGNAVTVAMVMQSEAAPLTGPAARNVAANAFTKRQVETALKAKLDAARKKGEIEYQAGFSALPQGGAQQGAGGATRPAAAPAPAPAS